MQKLSFKKAETVDLDFIKKFLKRNDLIYEDIETHAVELFLAYENSKFVGIIGLERFDNTGLLRSLAVDEDFRNQGYGKQICRKLIDYSKNIRIAELYLLTCTAKDFFEKIGFEVISRENVPKSIKTTTEFSSLCPNDAICMRSNITCGS